jgi:hypothetical protein
MKLIGCADWPWIICRFNVALCVAELLFSSTSPCVPLTLNISTRRSDLTL